MRRLDVIDHNARIRLHGNPIVAVILHEPRRRRKEVMPPKRRAREVRIQRIHDLIHTEHRAWILQHNEQSNGADSILRMLRGNQLLCPLNHHANVRSLLLCLQLRNIEGQCLRIVPVGKKVQRKVVEMQRQRIAVQEQKRARQCQARKPLDRH